MIQDLITIHQINVNIKVIVCEASMQQQYGLKAVTT